MPQPCSLVPGLAARPPWEYRPLVAASRTCSSYGRYVSVMPTVTPSAFAAASSLVIAAAAGPHIFFPVSPTGASAESGTRPLP